MTWRHLKPLLPAGGTVAQWIQEPRYLHQAYDVKRPGCLKAGALPHRACKIVNHLTNMQTPSST